MEKFLGSKDVAEVLEKRHDNLLRAIRKYCEQLGDEADKYFIPEGNGKKVTYKVTKLGCDLIAGRMIGQVGDEFKSWYIGVLGVGEKVEETPVAEPVSTDLTVEEVAKKLGCSERNVYRMIKAGKLGSIQKEILIPTLKTFVTEEALEACMAERGLA